MRTETKLYILFGDILALTVSFILTLAISFPDSFTSALASHTPPFLVLYVSWIIVLYIFNLYEPTFVRPSIKSISQLGLALITMSVVGFLMFYLVPWYGITPKTNLIINVLIFSTLLFAWRRILGHTTEKAVKKDKAVIFGEHARVAELTHLISSYSNSEIAFGGHVTQLSDIPEDTKIIIFMNSPKSQILQSVAYKNYKIISAREIFENVFYRVPVDLIDEHFLSSINHYRNILIGFIRRIIEIFFALLVLIVSLPITLITGLCILMEDKGPIFYSQKRVGQNGKIFDFYKFRSMKIDAEKNGAEWHTEGDNRVTSVGRIIRKLHIDEIPQMFNIIKGNLAIVGPRPERPEFVEKLIDDIPMYDLRHKIKPGFTGWAQINFKYARSVADSERKLEYDLYYLAHKNLFLDIGIILKTVQIIFTH